MEIRARKPGTLVYISNKGWRGYGLFNSMEHLTNCKGEPYVRVKLDAALEEFPSTNFYVENNLRIPLGGTVISWVDTMETCDAAGTKKYLSLLREYSKASDRGRRDTDY